VKSEATNGFANHFPPGISEKLSDENRLLTVGARQKVCEGWILGLKFEGFMVISLSLL